MKNLEYYLNVIEFIGSEMTDDQADRLMDEMRSNLSISDFEVMRYNVTGPIYTLISEHECEMGGYSRY